MNHDMRYTAYAIAKIAHAGQKYGDSDYFRAHVCDVAGRVVANGGLAIHLIVAYLHDTVEDTAVTLDDLKKIGFDESVIAAVDAITRRDGEDYLSDYIPRVKKNAIAAFVKAHDLKSNTNDKTPIKLAARNTVALKELLA